MTKKPNPHRWSRGSENRQSRKRKHVWAIFLNEWMITGRNIYSKEVTCQVTGKWEALWANHKVSLLAMPKNYSRSHMNIRLWMKYLLWEKSPDPVVESTNSEEYQAPHPFVSPRFLREEREGVGGSRWSEHSYVIGLIETNTTGLTLGTALSC